LSNCQVIGRSDSNQTAIQSLEKGVQAGNIGLDNVSGKGDSSELSLLTNDGIDSSSDVGNKAGYDSNDSLSIFFRDGGGSSTTVSVGSLDKRFKSLFVGVNAESTSETGSTSECIDLN
jgi:hypothetical protein